MNKKLIIGVIAAVVLIIAIFAFTGKDTSQDVNVDLPTEDNLPQENNIEEENRALGDVFFKYRLAINSKNLDRLKTYVTSDFEEGFERETGIEMTQETFSEQIAPLLISILPPALNVRVVDYDIDNDEATWEVVDMTNPNNTGTVEFVKEYNTWKIKKESWVEKL